MKMTSSASENLEQAVVQTTNNLDFSIISLISSADLVGKIVVFILIMASIWSWAIIVQKLIRFKQVKAKMSAFEGLFWSGQVLEDLYDRVKRLVDNPLTAVFVGALDECRKNKHMPYVGGGDSLRVGYKDRVAQAMYLAKNRSLEELEGSLVFLATVGASAPFIGLFGTTWGIMRVMHDLTAASAMKNATLATVAPGISEALFATAIGLFAAIPAFIFYNFLASLVESIQSKTDDFIGELNALLTRAIDEGKM